MREAARAIPARRLIGPYQLAATVTGPRRPRTSPSLAALATFFLQRYVRVELQRKAVYEFDTSESSLLTCDMIGGPACWRLVPCGSSAFGGRFCAPAMMWSWSC